MTTRSGAPVPRAHLDAFITSADADSGGAFTLTAATGPAGSQAITVTADGYQPRETVIRLPRTNEVVVDLISKATPYDETFYNQLARDAYTTPDADYPLYRWSSQLRFYLKTRDEFGRPLSNNDLETVRRGIREGVQYYTAGTYQADIVEGTETRPEQVGWVNVVPLQVLPPGDFCSYSSTVGGDPMTMWLRIDGCGCGSIKIPIADVIHEVGHAVGMFDVAEPDQIMNRVLSQGCREVIPTAKEQYHAALIYSRPRGNRSPDRDPGTFSLARPNGDLERLPGRP